MNIESVTPTVFGRCDCVNRIFPEHNAGMNRLYYVNRGNMLLKSEQGEILMKEGFLYLLPHNNINTITTEYVDHTFLNFYTFPQIFNENVIEIDISKHQVLKSAFDAINAYVKDNPGKSISSRNDSRRLFVGSFLSIILFLINDISRICLIDDKLVNDAIEYIHKNYSEAITVAELAKYFHMEQNSFIRRFKKHANVTPYQYLKKVRVNMAFSLMKGDGYDMAEIAKKVGYSDASTLSHAIKSFVTIG